MPKIDPKTVGRTVNVNGVKMLMKSIVLDKAGTKYYSTHDKEEFKVFPDSRPIVLFEINTLEMKKFVKSFLTVKENL